MDGNGIIKVWFCGTHLHSHWESLKHFITTHTNHVNSNNLQLLTPATVSTTLTILITIIVHFVTLVVTGSPASWMHCLLPHDHLKFLLMDTRSLCDCWLAIFTDSWFGKAPSGWVCKTPVQSNLAEIVREKMTWLSNSRVGMVWYSRV